MKDIIKRTAIFIVFIFFSCENNNDPQPSIFEYKVQTYYLIPSNGTFNEIVERKINYVMNEMQKWYQVATGGYTFEFQNDQKIVEIIYLNYSLNYYQKDFWNRITNELANRNVPINTPGLINYIWMGGVNEVKNDIDKNIIGLGGDSCNKHCGKIIIGTGLLIDINYTDKLPTIFHEMGHALGLNHPIDFNDLPVDKLDSAYLESVMCQNDIRLTNDVSSLGFLTNEKQILFSNPFMKSNIPLDYSPFSGHHINYPETDHIPSVDVNYTNDKNTAYFETYVNGEFSYFWQFGDGTISTEKNPTHVYPEQKNYYVILTTTSPGFMTTTTRFVAYLEW